MHKNRLKLEFKLEEFGVLSTPDLYRILKLRAEVFVVEQHCVYLDMDGKDTKAYHLLGYENDTLGAYARILPQGVSYPDYSSIGRVCTGNGYRGQGIGRKLMQTAILSCQTLFPNVNIKISAQSYLLKFYTELGFEAVGREYLEDDIPHMAMVYSFLTK